MPKVEVDLIESWFRSIGPGSKEEVDSCDSHSPLTLFPGIIERKKHLT